MRELETAVDSKTSQKLCIFHGSWFIKLSEAIDPLFLKIFFSVVCAFQPSNIYIGFKTIFRDKAYVPSAYSRPIMIHS